MGTIYCGAGESRSKSKVVSAKWPRRNPCARPRQSRDATRRYDSPAPFELLLRVQLTVRGSEPVQRATIRLGVRILNSVERCLSRCSNAPLRDGLEHALPLTVLTSPHITSPIQYVPHPCPCMRSSAETRDPCTCERLTKGFREGASAFTCV